MVCPRVMGGARGGFDGSHLSSQYAQKLTVDHTLTRPTQPTMPTTIDHTGFPEIIDDILKYASLKVRMNFAATSKHYRNRLCPVRPHVALHRNIRTNQLGVTTPDGRSSARFDPASIRIIDLTKSTWFVCSRCCLDFGQATGFSNLQVIRRLPHTIDRGITYRSGRYSLPRTRNLVDYTDLDTSPGERMSFNVVPPIFLHVTHHHIVHLRWNDDIQQHFLPYRIETVLFPEAYTFVLWPQSPNRGAGAAPDRAARYLPLFLAGLIGHHSSFEVTIVGPPRYRPIALVLQWRFLPYEEWSASLPPHEACVSEWAEPAESP